MTVERRPCSRCGLNRAMKFYGVDARRRDGISTVCSTCKRKRRGTTTRNQRLQESYGITEREWQELFDAQGGACAICGGKRPYNLDTDHDHALGNCREAVRGLLCKPCNRHLLPSVKDDINILKRAIDYLLFPPAHKVIKLPPEETP